MRKLFSLIVLVILFGAVNVQAFDPTKLVNTLKGSGNSTESGTGGDNKAGGIADAIGGIIGGLVANDKFSVDDLTGSWAYTSPAVSFRSENALMKIGGAGAATAVENKLEPYYNKLGFNKTTLTVDAEHNFTLKMGVVTLKGTVTKDDNNQLVFNFNAFNKIPLGKVSANATKSGSTLNITFDATRFVQLLTKLSSVLNIGTINTISSLLNSYDGIYLGFKLKAQ